MVVFQPTARKNSRQTGSTTRDPTGHTRATPTVARHNPLLEKKSLRFQIIFAEQDGHREM
jgi:hypothetical protein